MWRRSGLLGMLLTLTLLVSLAVPAFAVEPRPHAFYGTVTIGGLPAAVDTVITAEVEGGEGSYTTTVEGEYGDPPFDYLVVSGEIEGGALIKFYIDGAEAAETAEFHEGGDTELDLTIEVVPSVVTTNAASDITDSSATLNGSLDSLGDFGSVYVSFVWGTTSGALDQETSPPEMKTSLGAFSAGIIDLTSDTTYYFRAKATGSITVYGDELSFTTVEVGVTYDLTVASTAGGSVTEPGEGTFPDYDAGTVVDLLAVQETGYEFLNWTGDVGTIDDDTAEDTFITMNGDYSITANFALIGVTYDLTVASTAGGSVTEPGEGTFPDYDAGTVVDLLAVQETGYEFVNWTGDVDMVADVDAADTTITMNGDYSITANFALIGVTYDLTVASTAGGSVTEPGEGTFPDYDAGTVVDLLAVSEGGYKFVNWTGDVDMVDDVDDADTTITMNGDYSITANFAERVGFTTTLFFDWNLVSTPITLDADSDTLEQIFDPESVNNILILYRWDAVIKDWDQILGDYELLPLKAIYVKVKPDTSAVAEFFPSEELTWPPSRELVEGLNLIGPAPELEGGIFPAMPLDQALISIEEADGLRGYVMVISPEHNQPGWAYALGGEIENLLPYKGYWVVMERADTLWGFSTTPIQ